MVKAIKREQIYNDLNEEKRSCWVSGILPHTWYLKSVPPSLPPPPPLCRSVCVLPHHGARSSSCGEGSSRHRSTNSDHQRGRGKKEEGRPSGKRRGWSIRRVNELRRNLNLGTLISRPHVFFHHQGKHAGTKCRKFVLE